MDRIVIEGDCFETAVRKGLDKLGVDLDDVDVEVLEKGQKIMDVVLKPYKLLITRKQNTDINNTDDIFKLEYRQDGVYIMTLSSGNVSREQKTSIVNYLKRKKIDSIDESALFKAIHSEEDRWIRLAPAQTEKHIDEDIEVLITQNEMKAYITLLPPLGGGYLTKSDIIKKLHDERVVFGIDEQKIDTILKDREYEKNTLVAKGEEPIDGTDGEIVYHVSLDKSTKPLIKEDGNVDYFHLDIFENVQKGQLLATINPPTEGVAGKTVTGKKLKAKPGRQPRLQKGNNIAVSDDGLQYFADADGTVELIGDRIHVYNTLEINGNVDPSTGNIDFIGNVSISGNILTGFKVRVQGNIEVGGVVEGAHLEASGDIIIRQGIQGVGRGLIRANGNITSRFIENANIYCRGDIASEAIMHSYIESGGYVQVAGKRGLIVGGNIKAAAGITASVIGSPMATSTILEVGFDPLLRNEYRSLEEELEKVESEFSKSCQILNILDKLENKGTLPADKKLLKQKVLNTQESYRSKLPSIRARMSELEQMFSTAAHGVISASNTIYPGVQIIIGDSNMKIYENMRYTTLKREHGEIVSRSYKG